jgi:acyl-CoA dehydrogenase
VNFEHSAHTKSWIARVEQFMNQHVYPNADRYWQESQDHKWTTPPIVEQLKEKAKVEGLWNMFMPPSHGTEHLDATFTFDGPALSNLEYAPVAELTGRVHWSPEIFNCSAPDSGNMEILHRYGSRAQKEQWLRPIMDGEIRSAFLMTEPAVASSDARNIQTEIRRDGADYVLNGRKWFASGAGHSRAEVFIVMGKSDPAAETYRQQSMILVPRSTPGVTVVRPLPVFGFDHAAHGGHMEVLLKEVRVPASNVLLGEGRGFEIAQGRLGPGRIHHAMRCIGLAEAALEKMCKRLLTRKAFGKAIAEHSIWEQRIAEARSAIEMNRLLCLKAAYIMDTVGNKEARNEIAMIKVTGPKMAVKVVDDAIQAFGAAGVTDDSELSYAYADARVLRIVDGPDEVHNRAIARLELSKYRGDVAGAAT